MKLCWVVGGFLIWTLYLPLVQAEDLEKEKANLQGTWIAVRAESYGLPLEEEIKTLTLVISGDKITFRWPREVPMSFVLGSTDEHKTIDTTNLDGQLKGSVSLGIYSCEDNLLVMCFSHRKGERPKAFATARPPTPPRSLYIFKRAHP
jgi:uncharacterized protein (TIGR03067 family)